MHSLRTDRHVCAWWGIGAALSASTALTTEALAACAPAMGNTVICSGDLSGGVSLTNLEVVSIENVTSVIAPSASVPGALLVNSGAAGPSGGNGGSGLFGNLQPFSPITIKTVGADAASLRVEGGRGGDGVGTANGVGNGGGNGGDGTQARLSTASGTYNVTSTGPEIAALNVRSLGGGGGNGASPQLVPGVNVGGKGGDGGSANLVTLFLPSATLTTGGSGPALAVRA
ncbi:MAG: hypothetical protein WBG92_17075, partial [Thiohalocapsa sp.]